MTDWAESRKQISRLDRELRARADSRAADWAEEEAQSGTWGGYRA